VIETQGGHFAPAQLAAGQQPAMSGDDPVFAIDQDRYIEAEGLDTIGDLPDLLPAVPPGVRGIGLSCSIGR
jgi:hypothetical protein